MIPVTDLDAVRRAARTSGIDDAALRRIRIALFKKGRTPEESLARVDEPARSRFRNEVDLTPLTLAARHDSQRDGASKLIFRTQDGARLETVILRVASGRTSVCVSSQVGCGADCAFCATGRLGLTRNLTSAEIVDQILQAMRIVASESRVVRNVVFMGMGEPFHNEPAICEALEFLRDRDGCHLSERHLLVSTVGVHTAMRRFVRRYPRMRLALSLHSARQEIRERIMPTASFHSLDKLASVLPEAAAGGNLMIEYVLLEGVNDGPEDLAALKTYLAGLPVHINLIQFNPFPGSVFRPVSRAARETFGASLRAEGFKVTLRYSLGDDIAAACGQLAGSTPA